jgi:hypothetical protein
MDAAAIESLIIPGVARPICRRRFASAATAQEGRRCHLKARLPFSPVLMRRYVLFAAAKKDWQHAILSAEASRGNAPPHRKQ